MKKIIKITESQLINVIEKIVNEQSSGIEYKKMVNHLNDGGDLSGWKVKEIKRTGENQGSLTLNNGITNIVITDQTKPYGVKYFDNRVKQGDTYKSPLPKYINVTFGSETKKFTCGSNSGGGCKKV